MNGMGGIYDTFRVRFKHLGGDNKDIQSVYKSNAAQNKNSEKNYAFEIVNKDSVTNYNEDKIVYKRKKYRPITKRKTLANKKNQMKNKRKQEVVKECVHKRKKHEKNTSEGLEQSRCEDRKINHKIKDRF